MVQMMGTRVTAIKLPERDYGRIMEIELFYEELHPTKGWRKLRHIKRRVDSKVYDSAPDRGVYWIPNPDRPQKIKLDYIPPPPKKGREFVHAWQRKKRDADAAAASTTFEPIFPGIKVELAHGVL